MARQAAFVLPLAAVLAFSGACSQLADRPTVAAIHKDQSRALMMDCLAEPNRFGFPYTKAQYFTLRRNLPGFAPDLHHFCWRLSIVAFR